MRCTVDGLTPSRSAMTRMPGRPGVARASRIRFSSAGAIGGRPRRFPSLLALASEVHHGLGRYEPTPGAAMAAFAKLAAGVKTEPNSPHDV